MPSVPVTILHRASAECTCVAFGKKCWKKIRTLVHQASPDQQRCTRRCVKIYARVKVSSEMKSHAKSRRVARLVGDDKPSWGGRERISKNKSSTPNDRIIGSGTRKHRPRC